MLIAPLIWWVYIQDTLLYGDYSNTLIDVKHEIHINYNYLYFVISYFIQILKKESLFIKERSTITNLMLM